MIGRYRSYKSYYKKFALSYAIIYVDIRDKISREPTNFQLRGLHDVIIDGMNEIQKEYKITESAIEEGLSKETYINNIITVAINWVAIRNYLKDLHKEEYCQIPNYANYVSRTEYQIAKIKKVIDMHEKSAK